MTSLIACAPLARPTQVRTILDAAPSEAKFHSACKCSPRRALLSPQVRTILDAAPSEAKFHSAPLVLQFSSLSSPGTKPEWLVELVRSFCGTRPTPSAIEVHASAHHGALLSPQVRAQRRLRSRCMQVLTTTPSSPHRYAPNAVCDRGRLPDAGAGGRESGRLVRGQQHPV